MNKFKSAPADTKARTGGLDRALVSFEKGYEVRFWCNSLGCTESALRAAVRAVGNSADEVRAHLKRK